MVRAGYPVTLLTHWQSIFSHGTGAGLDGLEMLLERIDRVFGTDVRWQTCLELAQDCVRAEAPPK